MKSCSWKTAGSKKLFTSPSNSKSQLLAIDLKWGSTMRYWHIGGGGLLLFVGGWICCCPHSYVKYNDPLSFSLIHDSLKNRPGELRLSTFSYAMVIWAIITVVHYCVQVFCETKSVQWAVFFLIPLQDFGGHCITVQMLNGGLTHIY